MSFFWRVAALNAAAFAVGGMLLALSPATVSAPIADSELAILGAGILGLLSLNVLVLRWGFAPLDRLTATMRAVDISRPGPALAEDGPPEVRAVVATFNAMLDRLHDQRRAGSRAALGAEEAERARVARELHDEIGQSLTAVLMALARAAETAEPRTRAEIEQALEVARDSLGDVRRVAQRLRPDSLDNLGLSRAITTLCRRMEESSGLVIERTVASNLPAMPSEQELVIYRIAQECLTNVVRHAGASRAWLRLEAGDDGVLELEVHDDGQGLGDREEGGGMRGMRERALLADASLTIADRPAGGAAVCLRMPAATAVAA